MKTYLTLKKIFMTISNNQITNLPEVGDDVGHGSGEDEQDGAACHHLTSQLAHNPCKVCLNFFPTIHFEHF